MTIKDKRFPICSKHKLLRAMDESGQRPTAVSTGALRHLLGERLYQRCRECFTYRIETSPGPEPAPIERFLRNDKEARKICSSASLTK